MKQPMPAQLPAKLAFSMGLPDVDSQQSWAELVAAIMAT